MIVLANGCFDCLHIGHVVHLDQAAKLGPLTVALTLDEHVNKGPGKPVFCWEERAYMLLSLRCVKDVVPAKSGIEAICEIRPDIYVKGMDWDGRLELEKALVESFGGELVTINSFPVYSSSRILSGNLLRARIRSDTASIQQARSISG
jgi:cytidyltransferase-like protein